MKKIFTLIFALTVFASSAFAQCPNSATNPNPATIFFPFGNGNEAAALAYMNSVGGSGASVTVAGVTGIITMSGNASKPKITFTAPAVAPDPLTFVLGACDYVNGVPSVLPVELISFDGIKKDRQINLTWKTASEINNEGFEIQKSKDGIYWDILEFIEGNGTTFDLNTYTFIDRLPTQGANHYRLKQIDFDGEFEYSKVVSIDFNNQLNEVGMFPNPVNDQLTLINGAGEATIYNVLGQPVKQLTIDVDEATIQLADLLNGQYYLQLIQENGKIVTKQFSKVN